jgi:hypothetical protein
MQGASANMTVSLEKSVKEKGISHGWTPIHTDKQIDFLSVSICGPIGFPECY